MLDDDAHVLPSCRTQAVEHEIEVHPPLTSSRSGNAEPHAGVNALHVVVLGVKHHSVAGQLLEDGLQHFGRPSEFAVSTQIPNIGEETSRAIAA